MFHTSQVGYHQRSALVTPTEFADIPNVKFAEAVRSYKNQGMDHAFRKPEHAALIFYGLNHLAATILKRESTPYALLGKEEAAILSRYRSVAGTIASHMAAYMYLIVSREIRHTYSKSDAVVKVEGGQLSEAGVRFTNWLTAIPGGSHEAAQYAVDNPCQLPLGVHLHLIAKVFHTAGYQAGYGGKAWGVVADCLVNWCTGRISTETFLDTSFTLAHNNGPIFNKGMIFETYASKDTLMKVLDIQRAGCVWELLTGNEYYGIPVPITFMASDSSVQLAEKLGLLPKVGVNGWDGKVDWEQVAKAGALGHYSELYNIKKQAAQAAAATVTVYPGIHLEKLKRPS